MRRSGSGSCGDQHASDRPRRRRQCRVHPEPARRHPVVPGPPDVRHRPPRHRPGSARDRRADGPLDRRRARRRTGDLRASRPARGPARRRLRREHDPGRRRPGRRSTDVPARFGLRYTIADTIGVGGVFRGLRTIPVVLGIARDMEAVCLTPGSSTTRTPGDPRQGGRQATSIKVVGLCHSVFWTIDTLAGYLGIAREKTRRRVPGSLPPRVPPPARHRGGPLSRTASLRRGRPDAGRQPGPLRPLPPARLLPDRVFGASRRVQPLVHRQAQSAGTPWSATTCRSGVPRTGRRTSSSPRRSAGSMPASRSRSSAAAEYAATIAEGDDDRHPRRIVGSAMNHGCSSNLDADACVEVPCLVDGLGVHPVAMGPLPLHLAAYVRGRSTCRA